MHGKAAGVGLSSALVVLGVDLVAEEAGRGADGLLDDPGALRDARDELERVVAPRQRLLAVAARQEPGHRLSCAQQSSFVIPWRGASQQPQVHAALAAAAR